MTSTIYSLLIQDFLAQITPFEQLEKNVLQALVAKCQLVRYYIDQPIFTQGKMLDRVAIICQGKARLLGYDKSTKTPVSSQVVGSGEILGACSLVRGISCETAIASTEEVVCITVPAEEFLTLVAEPPLRSLAPLPKYPYVQGRGAINATSACFQMLSQHLGVSFGKDIRKALENQLKKTTLISLETCSAIAQMMDLRTQLVQVPVTGINQLTTPALIRYSLSFAIIYSVNEQELVMAIPEVGIRRKKLEDFAEVWGKEGQVLQIESPSKKYQEKFSWQRFLPRKWV